MKISTIGGNVAENSGGLRGLKYGITRDYVMGLEVVLASGEVVQLGNKCVKDVAGYSMKDVFIGSEGTLGIITRVLLKLVPKPASKKTLLATFSRMSDAADTVSEIIAAKIIPCTLEFLDRVTIRCVEEFAHVGLPLDAEAILLMETDGHPAAVADQALTMESIARQCGAVSVIAAETPEDAARLATARRAAFPRWRGSRPRRSWRMPPCHAVSSRR
jgi:glycolate oxidase